MRVLRGIARAVFVLVVVAALGVGGFVAVTLAHFGRDLPNYQQLANYVPATGTKVYAADGSFMAEFETEHRIPVTISQVPQLVVRAFLAAEDRDFYTHRGVNPSAIFRAAVADITRMGRGQRPIGASTITQQVVRHFLLSNEVSVSRKIKEALLAYRIEGVLSKNRILEIYLNEIYLGAGSYGVAAAADTYFQKPLNQLTLTEAAFLAALPKAPSNYNPIRHPAAAKARRDWVIDSMAELGWVSPAQASAAKAAPLGIHLRPETPDPALAQSGYFTEEVRRELVARFGEKTVYQGGLSVRTSYTQSYQQMAQAAFRKGLVEYDRRHGWRGALAHLASGAAAQAALSSTPDPAGIGDWKLAAVTAIDGSGATIALKTGGVGRLPLAELRWARRTLTDQRVGGAVHRVQDVVTPGDIVLVEALSTAAHAKGRQAAYAVPHYALRQIPDVSGGIVTMDPKTGRVYALVGGWSFQQSQFNRVTQAMRQPGSAFKPLVYVTALENGFTPYSPVDDAPVDIPQGPGLPAWQPVNYEGGYVGTTTLEDALVHSRNLATVHVAMQIGLPAIARTAQELGVMDKMPLYYSMALGAGETTLLRLTTAYAMIDNGGHWLMSSVIDLVQDRNGKILYQKGVNGCAACFVSGGPRNGSDTGTLYRPAGAADPSMTYLPHAQYADKALVYKPTKRDPLIARDADTDIISMMQGVVERGTGIVVSQVGKPLAGKTGTTSDWFDAWFVGFSPDLATGVFVGFDEPRTLGGGEVGGHVAAPIFRDFMMAALKDKPAKPFPTPTRAPAVAAAGSGAWGDSGGADVATLYGDTQIDPNVEVQDDGSSRHAKRRRRAADQALLSPDYGEPQDPANAPAYANADAQPPGDAAAGQQPVWGPFAPAWDQQRAAPANAYAAVTPSWTPRSTSPGWTQTYAPTTAAPAWGRAYAAVPNSAYSAYPGYSGYAGRPGYAAPAAPYGYAPSVPLYSGAGWAGQPTRGTGGLY
ncbi:MAG: penicillin-binding protein 1A [Thiohalocapsa sp.]